MLFTAPDGWGYFWACSTIGKIICEKCTKSRMGEEVKKKKINPNHQMLWTAPDGWGYFWAGAKLFVKNPLSPEFENR